MYKFVNKYSLGDWFCLSTTISYIFFNLFSPQFHSLQNKTHHPRLDCGLRPPPEEILVQF